MGLVVEPISGLPEISEGDDLAGLLVAALEPLGLGLTAGDVVVVAQKVVSKAEGAVRALADVVPGERANRLAERLNGDPRHIQVVLDESVRIVRDEQVLIVETHHGYVCANAGVDRSNVPGEHMVTLLPHDCDASAERLRQRLLELTRVDVAVIVSDTFGRPWRNGVTDVALGVAGMSPLLDLRGSADDNGRLMSATVIAVADELAAAAELVAGKTGRIPAVLIRGFTNSGPDGSGRDLIRPAGSDLFR